MTQTQPINTFEFAALAANIADAKKATETLVLDTGKVSYLADYFVICSGDNPAQIRTIADEIEKTFRKHGQEPIGSEHDKAYRWCLIDYGDVVIHVMNKTDRQYYQLEHFWNHASVVSADKWLPKQAS